MTPEDITALVKLSERLTTQLRQAADHIAGEQAKLQALEVAGMTTNRPTYRKEKYLYLVSPQQDGERTREYIGCDPAKIAAALAKIERQAQYDEIKARLDRYTSNLSQVSYELRHLVDATNPNRGKRE